MKRARFSEEQIIGILKAAEADAAVRRATRQSVGSSKQRPSTRFDIEIASSPTASPRTEDTTFNSRLEGRASKGFRSIPAAWRERRSAAHQVSPPLFSGGPALRSQLCGEPRVVVGNHRGRSRLISGVPNAAPPSEASESQ
jgi:hypothetical protein